MTSPLDCLIIGGGPAGLTAAIYLARFHLSVRVVDEGAQPGAAGSPAPATSPAFPTASRGNELLERMRAQAEKYGVGYHTAAG